MIAASAATLGVLAGGRGERVGGRDKAWLRREGAFLVDELLETFGDLAFAARLASVRADDARWGDRGFRCVTDLRPGQPGPLAGIEALAATCTTPWLLVVPVDVLESPRNLFAMLAALATPNGAWLRDAGGLQPLLGLWPAQPLHAAARRALDADERAVHRALAPMQPNCLDLSPRRLGNANLPGAFDPEP